MRMTRARQHEHMSLRIGAFFSLGRATDHAHDHLHSVLSEYENVLTAKEKRELLNIINKLGKLRIDFDSKKCSLEWQELREFYPDHWKEYVKGATE